MSDPVVQALLPAVRSRPSGPSRGHRVGDGPNGTRSRGGHDGYSMTVRFDEVELL